MHLSKPILYSIGFGLPVALAGSILDECTNLSNHGGWLSGNCLTGVDSTTRVYSAAYVEDWVGYDNTTNSLIWSTDLTSIGPGRLLYPVSDASDGFLRGFCEDAKNNDVECSINLAERFGNYNGHILYNYGITPSVPAQSPLTTAPAQDDYFGFFNAAKCGSVSTWLPITITFPSKCFFYMGSDRGKYYYSIGHDNSVVKRNYEILTFDNYDCTGEPIDRFGLEQEGCTDFTRPAVAFQARPLFNADYIWRQ